jgi:hypothetical protein
LNWRRVKISARGARLATLDSRLDIKIRCFITKPYRAPELLFYHPAGVESLRGNRITRGACKEVRANELSVDELQPEIAELVEALKRELLNNVARTLLFAGTRRGAARPQPYPVERNLFDANQSINLYEELREYEINLIRWALRQSGGKQKIAARLLGIKPTTLNNKIKHYNIAWKDKASPKQS